MDQLQYAIFVKDRERTELMFSALPDAPTLPGATRAPRAARARTLAAALLHRLGNAVAPAAAGTSAPVCDPAH